MEQSWPRFREPVAGTTEIAPEVIAVIAGIASLEVDGVSALSGGFVGDLREKLGRRNFRKGINVGVGAHEVDIDISVVVDYKQSIPHVANQIQHNVKRSVESMTSLSVRSINVFVTDIELPGGH